MAKKRDNLPQVSNLDSLVTPARALQLQKQWANCVRQSSLNGKINLVAGADVAFSRDSSRCVAGMVLLSFPQLTPICRVYAELPVNMPYIPGLLSFREAPVILAAAKKLAPRPDVLLIDGQGWAHPRRFGLACHVGVALNWPTIGCAKSRLIGTHRQPALPKGSRCRLMHNDQRIGTVLRTRQAVKCLYISVGHLIELDQAVKLVLNCCHRYRLPEPTRLAHQYVSRLKADGTVFNCV